MITDDNYSYRRQFVLGPRHVSFNHWNYYNIDGFSLSVHPELECIQQRSGDVCLTLIGYILDPWNTEADNQAILKNIANNIRNKEELFEKLYHYGGRWIIIYQDRDDFIILHDPAGLRQIYYTTDSDLWCGSQPEIIAQHVKSEKNLDIYNEFKQSEILEIWTNYFWPGEGSLYLNINRLLPNHYLDLTNRKTVRYWPNKKKAEISLEQGVADCSFLLKNQIKAASKRYLLAQSITAGWDSRLILAASKECFSDILYYTYKRRDLTRRSPDLYIPEKILKKFNRELIKLDIEKTIEPWFEKTFKSNTSFWHINVLYESSTLLKLKEKKNIEFVTINGNISETARCFYYDPMDGNKNLNPEALAFMVNMSRSQYAKEQFSKWLKKTLPIAQEYNYHILDLFYLEQKIGSWFSSLRTEYDIAEEVFSPYNCRVLLDLMLGVDCSHRQKKDPILYRRIIDLLWPDIMQFPINPPDLLFNIKFACKNKILVPIAKKAKVYDFIREHTKKKG